MEDTETLKKLDPIGYTEIFCPTDIMETSEITNAPFNKWGGPIWMDYSPGSYVSETGETIYKTKHKCEYVDKELIRNLFDKYTETGDEKYKKAIEYWLNN